MKYDPSADLSDSPGWEDHSSSSSFIVQTNEANAIQLVEEGVRTRSVLVYEDEKDLGIFYKDVDTNRFKFADSAQQTLKFKDDGYAAPYLLSFHPSIDLSDVAGWEAYTSIKGFSLQSLEGEVSIYSIDESTGLRQDIVKTKHIFLFQDGSNTAIFYTDLNSGKLQFADPEEQALIIGEVMDKYVLSCRDDDGGRSYYMKGSTYDKGGTKPFIDRCLRDYPEGNLSDKRVMEHWCGDDDRLKGEPYECPYGCKEGACIQETDKCSDSDGGKDYYVKGFTYDVSAVNPFTDSCQEDGITLTEHWCGDDDRLKGEPYECPYGCKDGACMAEPICEGCCGYNDCIPIGVRIENEFCDIDKQFKQQFGADIPCNNSYECSSNLCVDDQCVEPVLLQRFLLWLRGVLG